MGVVTKMFVSFIQQSVINVLRGVTCSKTHTAPNVQMHAEAAQMNVDKCRVCKNAITDMNQ